MDENVIRLQTQLKMIQIEADIKTRWAVRAGQAGTAIDQNWLDGRGLTRIDWEWLEPLEPENEIQVHDLIAIPPWSPLYVGPEKPKKPKRSRKNRSKKNKAKYLARGDGASGVVGMPAVDMRVEDADGDGFEVLAENADAENADAENADAENANAENADAENGGFGELSTGANRRGLLLLLL